MSCFLRFFILVIIAVSIVGAEAYAVSGAAPHEQPTFLEFLSQLWIYWFNFLLYVALLVYFLRKPLHRAWVARRLNISEQVAYAEQALATAKKALEQAKLKLTNLDGEIQQLKSGIQRESANEAEKIIEQANSKAAQVAKMAQQTAAAERKAAERATRLELVEMALKQSYQRLNKELTAESDRGLRSSAIGGVKDLVQ